MDNPVKRVKQVARELGQLFIKSIKLVADDVILFKIWEKAMKLIIQICADWTYINKLEWSTQKCNILTILSLGTGNQTLS